MPLTRELHACVFSRPGSPSQPVRAQRIYGCSLRQAHPGEHRRDTHAPPERPFLIEWRMMARSRRFSKSRRSFLGPLDSSVVPAQLTPEWSSCDSHGECNPETTSSSPATLRTQRRSWCRVHDGLSTGSLADGRRSTRSWRLWTRSRRARRRSRTRLRLKVGDVWRLGWICMEETMGRGLLVP